MELLQVIFIDRFHYFLSLQNIVEVSTFCLSLVSLLHSDVEMRTSFASISVLMSFMLFPLYIEKVSSVGIYVVAFKRTLANSAKFFPIFLILFTGFVFSFNLRTNFNVVYYKSGITGMDPEEYLSTNYGSIAGYSLLR